MKYLFILLPFMFMTSCGLNPAKGGDEQMANTDSTSQSLVAAPCIPKEVTHCDELPFDMTGSACDILGWQSYIYELELSPQNALNYPVVKSYKTSKVISLIDIVYSDAPLLIRQNAASELIQYSHQYNNAFGDFLYLLASNKQDQSNLEQKLGRLKKELAEEKAVNGDLKNQLAEANKKIEAIMEIEQNLNEESETQVE